MQQVIPPDYFSQIVALCRETGAAVLHFYGDEKRLQLREKADHTPLTEADLTAHRMLTAGLSDILALPVVSEESADGHGGRQSNDYWLIDPIDGTREFVGQTGAFCICIARIRNHRPSFGLIYAPVSGDYWYAFEGGGAYVVRAQQPPRRLCCRPVPAVPTLITARKHLSKKMQHYLAQIFPSYKQISSGSALKFCAIAEGRADIYPKLSALTSEWDTAAGDILLHEAGGALRYSGNILLHYGCRDEVGNPPFLAYGSGVAEAEVERWFALMAQLNSPDEYRG